MGCSASNNMASHPGMNNVELSASKWGGCLELMTKEELDRTISEEAAKAPVLLFVGYGSSAMFADTQAALDSMQPLLSDVQARSNGQPFTVVYGGDPSDANAPSIGYFMTLLKRQYHCQIVAITVGSSSFESDWAYVYRSPEDFDANGNTLYGGIDAERQPVGATRYYLGPGFIEPLPGKDKASLSGLVVLGGGKVAVQELDYADKKGVKWHYLPCAAKNERAYNSTFGPVQDWVAGKLGAEPPTGEITSGPL